MKKQLIIFLVLTIILIPFVGVYAKGEPQPEWIFLDDEQAMLTIVLSANATTGYGWTYKISNPDMLELIREEYIPDTNVEQLVGTGGTWAASFMGTSMEAAVVELTLKYKRDWEEEALQTRLVKVLVSEINQLEVISAEIVFPAQQDAE